MDLFTTFLIILLCLLLEGFFSGSEIGVISADQIKLRHQAAKGSKGAALALKMLEKPEWLLSITLVGTNISVVTNTTMVTALMIHLFGDYGSWLAVILAAPLIWIFGEIVPKSVFQQKSDSLTPIVIFVLRFFSYLFYPILIVFSFLTRILAKLAGSDGERNPFTLREEIVTMLHMPASDHSDIQPMEKNMIRRLFNFSETRVQEAMLPLIQVTAIEQQVSCGEARRVSAETHHIRLPIYDKRIDKIVGVLHTLDLLDADPQQPISDFIRPAYYVPANKSIKDLLFELRKEGIVTAIVVDEFGGAEGIVTIEDIMEVVVENLEDEYDQHKESSQWVTRLGERDYIVAAQTRIDDLCEQFDLELPRGTYTTLAGFILEKIHAVPERGATIKEGNVTLIVHRASSRAVQEVHIRW